MGVTQNLEKDQINFEFDNQKDDDDDKIDQKNKNLQEFIMNDKLI